MRLKIFFLTILIISFFISLVFLSDFVLADNEHGHESEIREGRELVESKISCEQLTNDQLEVIGEYLMEQMHPRESHEAMHQMMGLGEGTEDHKNFHINIARTMYCHEGGTMALMPMMNMMKGGGNFMMGNMMNGSDWGIGAGWAWFGWIFMILFWALIIIGILALIKWLVNQSKPERKEDSALYILKERYAKGEINKEEFEEKKKDLV